MIHNNGNYYGGSTLPDQSSDLPGGSFTTQCPGPKWRSNPNAAGKVGNTVLGESGELKLHPFMDIQQKENASMGLIGDNRHAPHFKLQQDLEAKSTQVDSLTQNLNASKAALEFFFSSFFSTKPRTKSDSGPSETIWALVCGLQTENH